MRLLHKIHSFTVLKYCFVSLASQWTFQKWETFSLSIFCLLHFSEKKDLKLALLENESLWCHKGHSYLTHTSHRSVATPPKFCSKHAEDLTFVKSLACLTWHPWFSNKYLKMGKTWDFQHHVLVQLSDYNIINPVLIQYVFLKYLLSTFSCMWPLIMFHIQDSKRSQKEAATALDEEQKNKQTGEADAIFLAKQVPSLAPPEPLISISM